MKRPLVVVLCLIIGVLIGALVHVLINKPNEIIENETTVTETFNETEPTIEETVENELYQTAADNLIQVKKNLLTVYRGNLIERDQMTGDASKLVNSILDMWYARAEKGELRDFRIDGELITLSFAFSKYYTENGWDTDEHEEEIILAVDTLDEVIELLK